MQSCMLLKLELAVYFSQPSNFVCTDLDKLGTNVRQPFLKILIGSAMASCQRSNERERNWKSCSKEENKQNKNALL